MLAKFTFRAGLPPEPRIDPVHADILKRVRSMLERRDVRGVVEHLNLHTDFRFTKISRFDPPFLRGVYLYDRAHRGLIDPTTQIAEESYSAIIRKEKRPFWTEDSMMDTRLLKHPMRETWRSYAGAPIKLPGGGIWGVLSHCDTRPRKIPAGETGMLGEVAELLTQELFAKGGAA